MNNEPFFAIEPHLLVVAADDKALPVIKKLQNHGLKLLILAVCNGCKEKSELSDKTITIDPDDKTAILKLCNENDICDILFIADNTRRSNEIAEKLKENTPDNVQILIDGRLIDVNDDNADEAAEIAHDAEKTAKSVFPILYNTGILSGNPVDEYNHAIDSLENLIVSICRIITTRGYINIDYADIVMTLQGQSVFWSDSSDDIDYVVDKCNSNLQQPGLTLKNLLLYIEAADRRLSVEDVKKISRIFNGYDDDNDISCIWGIGKNNDLNNSVRLSVFASFI